MYIAGQRNVPEWAWWTVGKCVVRVLRTGHFPETIMVELPDDKITEIDIAELEHNVRRD